MSDDHEDAPAFEHSFSADERRRRRGRDKAQVEADEARAFWYAVFDSRVGRREMWRLLEMGHAFEERFAADGVEAKTWLLAGEQRLAWKLYSMWRLFVFEGVMAMHRENDPDAGAFPST